MSHDPGVFSKRFQFFSRFVVIFVLWLIIGSIAIGKAGIANYMELFKQRDILKERNLELKIQNQTLLEDIARMKKYKSARIHDLKENYGYVETNNEYVYQFR